MQVADHFERQRTVTTHYLVDSPSLPNDAYQSPKILAQLLQAKSYVVERVGQVDRVVLALVGLKQRHQNLEFIPLWGAHRGPHSRSTR